MGVFFFHNSFMFRLAHYLRDFFYQKIKEWKRTFDNKFKIIFSIVSSMQILLQSYIEQGNVLPPKEKRTISMTFPSSNFSVWVQEQSVSLQVSDPHGIMAPGPGYVFIEVHASIILLQCIILVEIQKNSKEWLKYLNLPTSTPLVNSIVL